MNTEYPSYTIAKQLKEIGFDEPCFAYYDPETLDVCFSIGELTFGAFINDYLGPTNSQILEDLSGYFGISDEADDPVSAPTYYEVFKWFREKHGLYSCIAWVTKGYDFYIKKEHGKILNVTHISTNYRDAEIECIQYLINEVKKK